MGRAVPQARRSQLASERRPITAAALKLARWYFMRPGELRGARLAEFDLDGTEWSIPAVQMKTGELHVVPLASGRETLRELHALSGWACY